MKQKNNIRSLTIQSITRRLVLSILFVFFISSMHINADNEDKKLSELEKTAQSINQVSDIKANDKIIKLPQVPKGYKIRLKGSDRVQVIDNAGNITQPMVDADVNLYFKLIDTKTKEEIDVPNISVTVPGKYKPQQTDNHSPDIIPAIREWKGMQGFFTLPKEGSISVSSTDFDVLHESAEILKKDLNFFDYENYTIKSGDTNSTILLTLNNDDTALGEEGYRITIDNNIHLKANTPKGVFMGTRTILQLINKYGTEIPKGMIRDYPKYARRGLMIDVARKFFRLDFLQDYVKIMSYYKMNEFQVHLNDNGFKQFFNNDWSQTYSAFRLESETYPTLAATDGHYTKKEFTELQKLGMSYGVNVIPEIDVPAHSLAFTKIMPEIGSEEYGMDHLDINNPKTYEFVDKLFNEYIGGENPVFIGPDFHIGTDEYDKSEAESFRKFTDYFLRKVQDNGKRPRFWGSLTHASGNTPVVSDNVIMNAWYNGYAEPKEMIDQGYELISTSDRHLYIVPAAGYYYDYLNLNFLLNDWEPNLIGGDVFPFGHPQISGGMFAIWNDHCGNGISEKDAHHRIFPAMQVIAQKMWHGKDEDLSLTTFKVIADDLLEAPFVNIMGKIAHVGNTALYYDFARNNSNDLTQNNYHLVKSENTTWKKSKGLVFNSNSKVILPVEEAGYPHKVSFDITFDSVEKETVLFSSKNAEVVILPKEDSVQLGFKRDGYFYTFNTLLNTQEDLSLAISGDNKGTSLWIDGEEVERLEGIVKTGIDDDGKEHNMYIQQTLVFPLRTIYGFNGTLKSLKVEQGK